MADIDPRLIAALIMEDKDRKATQQRYGAPLPTLPPLPYSGPELRSADRPGSVTLPAEKGAAEGMYSILNSPYDAARSGVELYHNAKDGQAGPALMNAAELAAFGMGARRPKWAREEPRFSHADTSEIGAAPWVAGMVGGGGLGYAGSQLDDGDSHKGAVMGTALGTALGVGATLPMVRSVARRAEEAERASAYAGAGRAPGSPLASTTLNASAPMPMPPARARLIERLKTYPVEEARPDLAPADLAGPTGSRGTISNGKGESVYQDQAGNWKNAKTHQFTGPPDSEAMTSGFSDADLASARRR